MKGTEYVNLRTQLEEVTLQLQTDHDKGIINPGYSRPPMLLYLLVHNDGILYSSLTQLVSLMPSLRQLTLLFTPMSY